MQGRWLVGALAALPFFFGVTATATAQDRRFEPIHPRRQVALVVGNGKYLSSPLANPRNDATDVSARLRELGFDTDLEIDVDRKHLATAIDGFVGKLGAGDVAVFYYSGHGIQVDGENYLIPIDFDGNNETDVRYDAFAAGRVQEQMEKSGAQLNILILDACRNNAFRATKRGNTGGLAMMSAGEGTFLAFATSPGRTASDNPSGRNGLFTSFLLQALREPALSLDDVFNLVRERVAKTSGGNQVPWSQSAVIGRFVFVPGTAATLTPAKVDLAALVKQAGTLFDARNYEGALPLYRQAADAGIGHAEWSVGVFYDEGYGVKQNYAEAMRWYQKAAAAGDSAGMNDIGWLYEQGNGVNRDYGEAMRWYRKAADAGHSVSMTNIGDLYRSGLGVKRDYAEAMRWYRKGADEGDTVAMGHAGELYVNGEGVKQDYAEAMRWFRKAGDGGDSEGMNSVGVLYAQGLGVKQDETDAMRWFRNSADSGDTNGMVNLGRLYAEGSDKNYAEAMRWFVKAADAGYPAAMSNIGAFYLRGLGVWANRKQAIEWYRKAAGLGDESALKNLEGLGVKT